MSEQPEPKKGPLSKVKPRWMAQNLAVLGLGTGLGYFAGSAGARQLQESARVRDWAQKNPETFRNAARAAQAGLAVAGTFAADQARNVMMERLRKKRIESEKAEKMRGKEASIRERVSRLGKAVLERSTSAGRAAREVRKQGPAGMHTAVDFRNLPEHMFGPWEPHPHIPGARTRGLAPGIDLSSRTRHTPFWSSSGHWRRSARPRTRSSWWAVA